MPRYRKTLVEMRHKFCQGDLRQRKLCTDTKECLGEGLLAGSLAPSFKKLTLLAAWMVVLSQGCLEDHRWQIPVVSLGWTWP